MAEVLGSLAYLGVVSTFCAVWVIIVGIVHDRRRGR